MAAIAPAAIERMRAVDDGGVLREAIAHLRPLAILKRLEKRDRPVDPLLQFRRPRQLRERGD